MNKNWNEVSEDVWRLNLSNVLVLTVAFYEGHGWRGSIEGAFDFPSNKSFSKNDLDIAKESLERIAGEMLQLAILSLGKVE